MRALVVVVYLLAINTKIQCGQLLLTTLPLLKTANFQCLKSSGIDHIALVLIYNQTGVQEQSAQNIANALTAGLSVEVIFLPNRDRSVQDQILTMKKYFNWNIDRYWMLLNQWDIYTPYQNCQYLQEFLAAVRDINLSVGIWTRKSDWINLFKDQRGCPEASNTLLWWIPDSQFDGQPNFNNYNQIGDGKYLT